MRNFLVPQSTQVDRVAARPFFMVTASISLEAVLGNCSDLWGSTSHQASHRGAAKHGICFVSRLVPSNVNNYGLGPALDAVNLHGFGRGGHRWTLLKREWRRQLYPTVAVASGLIRGQRAQFDDAGALRWRREGK